MKKDKNTATTETREETREPHALDRITLAPDRQDWQAEERVWQNEKLTLKERIGWLHTHSEGVSNSPKQLVFYLDIADRYGEPNTFMPAKISGRRLYHVDSITPLQSVLARKAFAVLCSYFFSRDTDPYYPHPLLYKEPLLSKLLWFFRPYDGNDGWDNLRPREAQGLGKDGGRHYIQTVGTFAKKFALDLWQILNHRWYWLTDWKPEAETVWPHRGELFALMSRLDGLGIGFFNLITHGQYAPERKVLDEILRYIFEKEDLPFYPSNSANGNIKAKETLEGLIIGGHPLAMALYAALLNVREEDTNTEQDAREQCGIFSIAPRLVR